MVGMRVVLASGSPRRRELLAREGVEFEVKPSPAEELGPGEAAWDELCLRNAELKARAVPVEGAWVIGADTLVQVGGKVLGKPRDMEEAREMLRALSGREHEVRTGVCIIGPDGREHVFQDITKVRFRELGEEDIDAYFALVDPLDKAGAYGIQEAGERIVEGIEGDFDNVVGLPVGRVVGYLRTCGWVGL